MPSISHWIEAARPKTLGAAIAPVLVGTALGRQLSAEWHPWLALCTLLSTVALQVATNWFNDAIDFVKGSDTAERLGPRRITASGVVTPQQVITAALVMLGIATALSIPLVQARGWPIIAIGVPSLYFCYGYTGGPAPLAYRGLGELFVILFFGLIAVTGSTFVQTGQWHSMALWAGLQTGCLSTVLIAINNLRDLDEDSKTGKRTLAVRFGERFAKLEITALIVLAVLLQIAWWWFDFGRVILRSGVWVGGAALVVFQVWNAPRGTFYNKLLMISGIVLVIYALTVAFSL
jgi:1,4-dihydroxy-2-naphthoate octaprenyltransferase